MSSLLYETWMPCAGSAGAGGRICSTGRRDPEAGLFRPSSRQAGFCDSFAHSVPDVLGLAEQFGRNIRFLSEFNITRN